MQTSNRVPRTRTVPLSLSSRLATTATHLSRSFRCFPWTIYSQLSPELIQLPAPLWDQRNLPKGCWTLTCNLPSSFSRSNDRQSHSSRMHRSITRTLGRRAVVHDYLNIPLRDKQALGQRRYVIPWSLPRFLPRVTGASVWLMIESRESCRGFSAMNHPCMCSRFCT